MKWSTYLLLFVLCAGSRPAVGAGEGAEAYLKEGQLAARLEVHVLQGGFAGFTGAYYLIEPDGAWSTGPMQQGKGAPKFQGRLSAEQLAQLAKALASHELATLPSSGKPVVNPRVIRISFGKTTSELVASPGRAAGGEADQAIRARYAEIVQAVKGLCRIAANENK